MRKWPNFSLNVLDEFTVWISSLKYSSIHHGDYFVNKSGYATTVLSICSSYNFNPLKVCFQFVKVNCNMFAQKSIFGPILKDNYKLSHFWYYEKDGDGQNVIIKTSQTDFMETKSTSYLKGTYHAKCTFVRLLYMNVCPRCSRELTKCQKT